MGFLIWRPQLLSEPWDQVSLGNNWRPLEKNTLRTWQQAEARPQGEGRGGGWSWPKCRPRLDPSPPPRSEGQLRGERAWAQLLASPRGAHAGDRWPGAGSCGHRPLRPLWSRAPLLPSPSSFRPGMGKGGRAERTTGLGKVLWGPKKKRWGGEGRGQGTNMPLKGVPIAIAPHLRQGRDCRAGEARGLVSEWTTGAG